MTTAEERATTAAREVRAFVEEHDLLTPREEFVRLPHLVRGQLVAPPYVDSRRARDAIGSRRYATYGGAQLVRTTNGLVAVLPAINVDALAPVMPVTQELAALATNDAFEFIASLRPLLPQSPGVNALCDPSRLRIWVDREIAWGGIPGCRLLDGWEGIDGVVLRAMPTRQLHIPSSNTPTVPLVSAVRGLAVKGAVTIKAPASALGSTGTLALALGMAWPGHPLSTSSSVVYFRGGDQTLERELFRRARFDRIVVHGSDQTIDEIRSRCTGVKVVAFGSRAGASLIAPSDDPREAAALAVADAMLGGGESCDASLVRYVEGTCDRVLSFAQALRAELATWDATLPPATTAAQHNALRATRRGDLWAARWLYNGSPARPDSAVVVAFGDVPAWKSPMPRALLVQGVDRLEDGVRHLGSVIGTVGVYPEERRLGLRDTLATRGVTAVVPLGEAAWASDGLPRDGLRPMSELVRWVVG